MKKTILFSFFMLLFGLMFISTTETHAQSSLTKVWLDTAGTYINGVAVGPQWFKKATTGNNVRGMAYNPVTGHVLVASRDSAYNCIMILNGATGDTLGRLNMTGIDTASATRGVLLFNRVAVSNDGKIYSTNLQTSINAIQRMKIYQWDNETAPARVAYVDGAPALKWSVPAGVPWMKASGDLVRGVALSPDGSKLYVASRETGYNAVVIVNTATGDTIGRLDNTGISGGDNIISRVGVSGDGKVYLCNLRVTPTKVNTFKIYYYASDTSKPVVAFSDSVYGRQGDALAVVGSGALTFVYVGGNGVPSGASGTYVHIFQASTDNNDTLTLVRAVKADGYSGALGLGPNTTGLGAFWINTSGRHAALYDTSGVKLDSIQGTVLGTGVTTAKPFTILGNKYILGYDYTAKKGYLVDVRYSGINAQSALITPASGANANGNGTGDVLYNPKDTTILVFGTNNGIYVYSLRPALPGVRQGDALAVSGTGTNRYVYVGGNIAVSAGTYVNTFNANTDTTLVLYKSIFTTAYPGALGFGPVADGFGKFWINRSGNAAVLYDTTGSPLDTVSTGIVASGASTAHYFEFNGRKFLGMIVTGSTPPSILNVVDITNSKSKFVVAKDTLGSVANANGTAEVYFVPGDTALISLTTNNSIKKSGIRSSNASFTFISRSPYVPKAGEADTVLVKVLSMAPLSAVNITVNGYKTASSDLSADENSTVTMSHTADQVFSGVIPASYNRNGRRINYSVSSNSAAGVVSQSAVFSGYFAGTTLLSYKGGPRDIDSTGFLMWSQYAIRVAGVVTREDSIAQVINLDVVVQDSLGGATIFSPLYNGVTGLKVTRGKKYEVEGKIAANSGNFQIREQATGHPTPKFVDLGPGVAPTPVRITLNDLKYLGRGEELENVLVEILNVKPTVSSLPWPDLAAASTGTNMTVTDNGTDSVTMRVYHNKSDLRGTVMPFPWKKVIGIAGQFDATAVKDSFYQFNPRDRADFTLLPTLPLTFEPNNVEYAFVDFSGATATRVPNPQVGGINTSANVMKVVKGAGDPWAGSYLTLLSPIQWGDRRTFSVKAYMPKVGSKLLFKVENLSNGAINMEKEAVSTVANAWQEFTFDFTTIDTSKTYQKIVIIGDLGTVGDGSANFTYLIDDINLIKSVPVLPLDFELNSINYIFTDFDGGAATRIVNPQSNGINTSGFVGKMVKSAGQVWGGSYLSLAGPMNFSANKIFLVKVFMPKVGAKLLLKVENQTDGAVSFEREVIGTVANAWEELKIDFSAIDTSKRYQKLVFIFDNGTMGDGSANFTYLFDDIRLLPPPPPVIPSAQPVFPLWAKTKAAGTFPLSYINAGNYERGMAAGVVDGKKRVFVVSRSGGPKIISYDAVTGDSVGVLFQSATPTSGTFPLNAVEVSDDGVILACNMTTDAAASNFKVYRWNKETDSVKTVIDYNGAGLPAASRIGDMMSVYGKASDNTLTLYAAVSGQANVVKFKTTDNGKTFTPSIIVLNNGAMGTQPNVVRHSDGSLYVKSYGKKLTRHDSTGVMIDSISGGIVGTDVTNIKAVDRKGQRYIICYYPNDGTNVTDERFTVVNVTNPQNPLVELFSPSIGNVINGNGTGAVDVITQDSNTVFFMLGTNNGIAAFTPDPMVVVKSLDTLSYITSKNLLKNPYGKGFIAGVNSYGDIGKYQRFDFKKQDILGAFTLYFGYKQIVGAPDTLQVVVRSVDSTVGAPKTLLQSMMLTADMMDTTKQGNTFILPSPIKLLGPVFIGFEWSKTGNDTFAVYTDKNGEGNLAGRAWERFSDSSFNDFGTKLNPSFSWDLDADLHVAAYYKKGTTTGVISEHSAIPTQYALEQNYPNPFNPSTTIRFALPKTSRVRMMVYDILGREVRALVNSDLDAGTHHIVWDGKNNYGGQVATGMYIYRIEAGSFISTKKMMLLK